MTSFIYKQIKNQSTVAERLKSKRLALGYKLEKISKTLSIEIKYLQALESGDFHKLPGDIYVRQWLKIYGQLLDLSVSELIKDYQQENKLQLSFTDYRKTGFKLKKHFFSLPPRFVRNSLIGLVVVVLIIYLGWEVKKIIEPPPLAILEPINNSTTVNNKITIKGQTKPEVIIWINNQQVLTNSDGLFEQEVELISGLNTFQISAKKKNSQKNNVTLSIIKVNNDQESTNSYNNNLSLIYKTTGSFIK